MEFYEVLEKRHSCREFLGRKVEKEKLARIIKAALSAPSAGNLQAYQIYIASSDEAKQSLMQACMDQEYVGRAPAVLVFCADKNQSGEKYGERGMDFYSVQDATITAAYLQLAATAEGLASVWVGAFDPLEVSYIIKAEPGVVPMAVIPLGYPAREPEKTERRPIEEIIKEV